MRTIAAAGCLALLWIGCGNANTEPVDNDAGATDAEVEDAASELRVATYNAGLAFPVVSYAKERAPLVSKALAGQSLDVLCIQEFWQQEDWDNLVKEAKPSLPYALRRPAEPGDAGGRCTEQELQPLVDCIDTGCGAIDPNKLANCVLANCALFALGLSSPCLNCLYANIGLGEVDPIVQACETGSGQSVSAGRSYAYGGSFGTGVLSAYKLEGVQSLLLDSTMTRRAVLYGRISKTPIGQVHLFCTHLTTAVALPYNDPEGEFTSFEQEQSAQVAEILAFIQDKTGPADQVLLMGDFNAGPSIGSIQAELQDNYRKLIDAGFRDPYAEQSDVQCTFCADNPLNQGSGSASVLIDHIFTRGVKAKVAGEQFMRDTVEVTAGGATVKTAYSDHYGLKLLLSAP